MTLKTSSRKINPFGNMIGFTIRKNIGVIIVLCILALLYCPGSYIVNFDAMYESSRWDKGANIGNTGIFGTVIMIFAPLFTLLFNFINFSFLYKKSASDVFHAFPLTRTELLISRMLSGIISSFVPVVVCSLCYVVMMIFNPWIGHFGMLLYYLAVTLIIVLIWSAFSLLFVVCAGSAFDLSLSFLGVNLAVVFISLIFEHILQETLLGYSGDSEQILYNLCLPYFCSQYETLEFLIRSVIYIAVFTVSSVLLYNKRKAEKGGTAYAYKFMYLLCSVIAGICGGYLVGILFDNNIFSLVFWLFATIGAILTSMIYGLVTNRGFKGILRSILMGGVASVTMLAVMIYGLTGGLGYSKFIPAKASVKTATVEFQYTDIEFEDPKLVIALHEKMLETDAAVGPMDDNYYKYGKEYLRFKYELPGGIMVERNFNDVEMSQIDKELLAIYQSEEHLKKIKQEAHLDSKSLYVDFQYGRPGTSYDLYSGYISVEKYEKLLDAYWKDIQNLDSVIPFYTGITGYLSFDVESEGDMYYFSYTITDEFENTMSFINDNIQYYSY